MKRARLTSKSHRRSLECCRQSRCFPQAMSRLHESQQPGELFQQRSVAYRLSPWRVAKVGVLAPGCLFQVLFFSHCSGGSLLLVTAAEFLWAACSWEATWISARLSDAPIFKRVAATAADGAVLSGPI